MGSIWKVLEPIGQDMKGITIYWEINEGTTIYWAWKVLPPIGQYKKVLPPSGQDMEGIAIYWEIYEGTSHLLGKMWKVQPSIKQ